MAENHPTELDYATYLWLQHDGLTPEEAYEAIYPEINRPIDEDVIFVFEHSPVFEDVKKRINNQVNHVYGKILKDYRGRT